MPADVTSAPSAPAPRPAARGGLRRPTAVEALVVLAGLALVWRYRFFFDDCFVYFRYVDNLLWLRIGLVYNAGEYVEGFSSPLWTLLLVPLRATGLGWEVLVPAVGLAGFVAFAGLLVALNRELAPPGVTVNLPLVHLGLAYGVLCSFTSGMETVLVQVGAAVWALFVLRPASRPLQVLVALLPLVRPELVLPFAVGVVWSAVALRRPPVLPLVLAALLGGAWLAFRVVYYADLLPNTFYLKDGVHPAQGWRYVVDLELAYHAGELLLAAAVLAVLLRRRGVRIDLRPRVAMLLGALPVALYVVRIGGAPLHYRYLAFPYVVALCAAAGLPERALVAFVPRLAARVAPLLALGLAALTASLRPRQLDRHPLRAGVECTYVDDINDAAYHRRRIGTGGRWRREAGIARQRAWRAEHPDFAYAGVVRDGWCARAYRSFDKRVVHGYGLTDILLAHVDTPATRPAHKPRLQELARDLVRLHGTEPPGRGVYRRAVEEGRAPRWIAANLPVVEVLERKLANRHRPLENLRLAFAFPPRLRLEEP